MSEMISPCQPEKAGSGSRSGAPLPKPAWLKVRAPLESLAASKVDADLRAQKIRTVCELAACPNQSDCWSRRHASFMILGDACTRACRFCNVKTARPTAVDETEPGRLAAAAAALSLSHVVVTSVTRDDLPDGGAAHFAACIRALRHRLPDCSVEVLTPDFKGKEGALTTVLNAAPDVFNHNVETVPRLYGDVRSGALYDGSIRLLAEARRHHPSLVTKSGLMVGLGETDHEVLDVMDDLRQAGVDFLTIGQYLQPTRGHREVSRYVSPDEFDAYARLAREKGFALVASSPLTRSSHHADLAFRALRAARADQQDPA